MNWQLAIAIASLAVAGFNAWLTTNVRLAVAILRGEMVERVAKCEVQIENLRAAQAARVEDK